MWAWLNGPGAVFREPREGSTNYLGAYDRDGNLIRDDRAQKEANEEEKPEEQEDDEDDADESKKAKKDLQKTGQPDESEEDLRPFPLNPHFRSQSVLSTNLRKEIFKRVTQLGQSIREVSQTLHVEMSRVAAVVRLMSIERQWDQEGTKLAKPYQRAILDMVPTTNYDPNSNDNPRHESINDLPVHRSTLHQVFHPTSESRHFTRVDAGKVFKANLLPAEERIPHPDMIRQLRESRDLSHAAREELRKKIYDQEVQKTNAAKEAAKAAEARKTQVVDGKRWAFRIENVNAEDVGRAGRSPNGVGWRYGMPLEDRKKGQVKIPTKV